MRGVRWKPLVLSVVPGFGHMYFRRYMAGVVLFAAFAVGLNGLMLLVLVRGDASGPLAWLAAGVAIGAWCLSVLWVLRRAVLQDVTALREQRHELCRRGLVHYLRGEYTDALEAFGEANRVGPEAAAADVLMMLAATQRRLGNVTAARRLLRRSAAWDADGTWTYERRHEVALLSGTDAVSGERASTEAPLRLPLRSWTVAESGAGVPR
jgi:tetratricopeptide (TPR) repeat protein